MRQFTRIVLALTVMGLHGSGVAMMKREFEISYQGTISQVSPTAQEVRVWVPLGTSRDGQKILSREIQAPVPHEISKDPEYGNEILSFSLRPPFAAPVDFSVQYHVVTDEEQFLTTQERIQNIKKHLQPSRLMVVNEEIQKRSDLAAADKLGPLEKARGIYEYVLAHMRYDKTIPGWGRGDTVRACRIGTGNCTDFHSLFISLAHAAEIPARFKIGLTIPKEKEGKILGYHCWAEFYEKEAGWEPVDASEAWKHPEKKEEYFARFDPNKFFISIGRDIQLVPRQKGEPVNIFFYPYIEVDGKPYEGFQASFYYRSLT